MVRHKTLNKVREDSIGTHIVIIFRGQEFLCYLDKEDLPTIGKYTWFARQSGHSLYIQTSIYGESGRRTSLQIHRLLMGVKDRRQYIDHINRNTLDNRKSNLRILTPAESAQNKNKYMNSTSQYRGVSWHEPNKKWVVKGGKNGKIIHLGYFNDEHEAGLVAARWRKEHLPYAEDSTTDS